MGLHGPFPNLFECPSVLFKLTKLDLVRDSWARERGEEMI